MRGAWSHPETLRAWCRDICQGYSPAAVRGFIHVLSAVAAEGP